MNRQAEFTGHRMDIDPGGRVPVNRFLCELIRVNHDLTTVSHDPRGANTACASGRRSVSVTRPPRDRHAVVM